MMESTMHNLVSQLERTTIDSNNHESTENDAIIARLLAEDESNCVTNYSLAEEQPAENETFSSLSLITSSRNAIQSNEILPSEIKIDEQEHVASTTEMTPSTDIHTDSEIAYLLQIEEIILMEERIDRNSPTITDQQIAHTKEKMLENLQPTTSTGFIPRLMAIFSTIIERYSRSVSTNEDLVGLMRKAAVKFGPLVLGVLKQDAKANVAKGALALGVMASVVKGDINLDDVKLILTKWSTLWENSSDWMEFFETAVYLMIAVTFTSAMGKFLSDLTSKYLKGAN